MSIHVWNGIKLILRLVSISVSLDVDCDVYGDGGFGVRINFHPAKGELSVSHCHKMAHSNALFGRIIQRAQPTVGSLLRSAVHKRNKLQCREASASHRVASHRDVSCLRNCKSHFRKKRKRTR